MTIKIKYVLLVLMWGALFLAAGTLASQGRHGMVDYSVYHNVAELLLDGETLYQGTQGLVYLYPPLLAQLLMPVVSLLRFDIASLLWFVVSALSLVLSVYMVSRYTPASRRAWFWLLPLTLPPLIDAFYVGQVTFIMLGLLTLTWFAAKRGRLAIAGLALTLACWIKVYPALLVVYFIWKRQFNLVLWIGVFGSALLVLQVIISGFDTMGNFFAILAELGAAGQPEWAFRNSSINGFASRLFGDTPGVTPLTLDETLLSATRYGLTLFVLAVSAYATYQTEPARDTLKSWRFDIEYGLVILVALLSSATLWLAGLPPLILVYLLILCNMEHYPGKRNLFWLPALSILIWLAYYLYRYGYDTDGNVSELGLSLGFFNMLFLWAMCLWPLVTRRRTDERTSTLESVVS